MVTDFGCDMRCWVDETWKPVPCVYCPGYGKLKIYGKGEKDDIHAEGSDRGAGAHYAQIWECCLN